MPQIRCRGILGAVEERYREALSALPELDAPVDLVPERQAADLDGAVLVAADIEVSSGRGHARVDAADPDAVAAAAVLAAKGYAVHPASGLRGVELPIQERCIAILRSLVEHGTVGKAAEAAGYSTSQFRRYLRRAADSLGARHRHQAIAIATELGLLA